MKQKKFKKIVEWNREPNWFMIIGGVFLIILGLIGFYHWVVIMRAGDFSLYSEFFILINSLLLSMVGFSCFLLSLGDKKREYFVEVIGR